MNLLNRTENMSVYAPELINEESNWAFLKSHEARINHPGFGNDPDFPLESAVQSVSKA